MRRQSAGAACQNYRPVQTCNARLDARSATASLPDHHANAALRGVRRCSRIFFGRIVNRSEKLPQKNKIYHEVRSLDCDLMWKRFVLPDCPVNSQAKGEHLSYSRAAHVPAGGRNRSPRTSRHQLAAGSAARVCWWPKRTCRPSRPRCSGAKAHGRSHGRLPAMHASRLTPPAPSPKIRRPRCAACRTGCRVRGRSPAPRTPPCRSPPPPW